MNPDDERRAVLAELDAIDRGLDLLEQREGAHPVIDATQARVQALRLKWSGAAETLAMAAANFDVLIQQARRLFEDSLIANSAPSDRLDDLLDDAEQHLQDWRDQTLADLRQALLDPAGWDEEG